MTLSILYYIVISRIIKKIIIKLNLNHFISISYFMFSLKYLNYLKLIWFYKRILAKFIKNTKNNNRIQKHRSNTTVTKCKLYSLCVIEHEVKLNVAMHHNLWI